MFDSFEKISLDAVAALQLRELEVESLRAELDALKAGLRWQTGKPPKDGWYWVKYEHTLEGLKLFQGDPGIDYLMPSLEGCWKDQEWSGPIPLPGEKSALQERLEEAERVIDEFADGLNWQSAGIYEGQPSEVLLWTGWMRGKSNGPHLARSYRAKYPRTKGGV